VLNDTIYKGEIRSAREDAIKALAMGISGVHATNELLNHPLIPSLKRRGTRVVEAACS
jgi:hypothetical protein